MSDVLERRDLLLSIRPNYVDDILNGKKTVELRRRFSEAATAGSILLIYSTSPTQAVVGYATIEAVKKLPLGKLWKLHGKDACVSREEFDQYFSGVSEGFAILLKDVTILKKRVSASHLREKLGFVPPQSFMYLTQPYYRLMRDGRI
jgi:predicted transcriptional regulator